MKTNFWSLLNVTNQMYPLFASKARVVNISSEISKFTLEKLGPELQKKLLAIRTVPELDGLMRQFVQDTKDGKLHEKGWPSDTSYGISKLAVTTLTKIHAAQWKSDPRHIVINCCCPGYTPTGMTKGKGTKSIEEAVDTPVYLALNPADEPYGELVINRKVVSWQ